MHKQKPEIPPSIPELPINLQRKLPIYLTKTLEIQVNPDHYEYWAWSAEIFMSTEVDFHILKVRDALQSLFHTVLAKLSHPPRSNSDILLNRILEILVSRHVHHMVINKMLLAAPLAFLCFEAYVRYLCSNYVDPVTGRAKKDFKKLNIGKNRTLTLYPLLTLFNNVVLPELSSELKHNICLLNDIVGTIWKNEIQKKGIRENERWIDILVNWRNNLIHGKSTWIPRAFGVVTNYICLILWHFIPDDKYTKYKERILERIKWQYGDFYPP